MSIRGPLVAECEGVSAEEREAFVQWIDAWGSTPSQRASPLPHLVHLRGVRWRRETHDCCRVATYWVVLRDELPNVAMPHTPPPCPVCDPIGARAGDAHAIDKLARALWRARPDVVLAEMDRKLEAAELGGDALEALVAVGEQLSRCEAENERLRAELVRVRDAAVRAEAERDRLQDPYAVIRERFEPYRSARR